MATIELEKRNQQLQETNLELWRTNRRMNELGRLAAAGQTAAHFAHEVGTPLNLISGHVQLLLSQDVYGYGYHGVEHLINKIHFKKDPSRVIDDTPLTAVTKDNVEEFAKNWEKWLPK